MLVVTPQMIVCIWAIHKEQGHRPLQDRIWESLKDTFTFNIN